MLRGVAVVCGLFCTWAVAGADTPVLRDTPGQPAPSELVARILEANQFWLHPPVKSLTYTFRMKSAKRGDEWGASVAFTAPDSLVVSPTGHPTYQGKVDDSYDPENSAYPPRLTTILQGVTFFGPLHEWSRKPEEHEARLIAEEQLDGKDAYVLQLKPTRAVSPEAVARWEQGLKKRATHPQYLYEFLPVEKEIEGAKKVVIELTCLHEEGPGWAAIRAAHDANPTQVKWGGRVITAAIRPYRGQDQPVIVLDRDPDFQGQSPITLVSFAGGVNNLTPKLTLGEGESAFDQQLYDKLKADEPKPEPWLAMRVGCGIWGTWFGYSGGGAQVDQLWVEKATGMVLREEGFGKGKPRFTVEYGDFEASPDGRQTPRHVVVTLPGEGEMYPWVFDMKFTTLHGTVWVLDSMTELMGGKDVTATAQITDAIGEAEAPRAGQ